MHSAEHLFVTDALLLACSPPTCTHSVNEQHFASVKRLCFCQRRLHVENTFFTFRHVLEEKSRRSTEDFCAGVSDNLCDGKQEARAGRLTVTHTNTHSVRLCRWIDGGAQQVELLCSLRHWHQAEMSFMIWVSQLSVMMIRLSSMRSAQAEMTPCFPLSGVCVSVMMDVCFKLQVSLNKLQVFSHSLSSAGPENQNFSASECEILHKNQFHPAGLKLIKSDDKNSPSAWKDDQTFSGSNWPAASLSVCSVCLRPPEGARVQITDLSLSTEWPLVINYLINANKKPVFFFY